MKVVLIGGHLSPALSVIEALPKDAKILFIGRKHAFEGDKAISLEYTTITSLNIPFVAVNAARLQGRFTVQTLISLLKIPLGIIESFFVLSRFKPDVVVGFGGYVSVPVVLAAFLMRIPVVIHEQTLEAGLANRFLGIFAKKICISWNSSRKFFPKKKTVLTGNPIRKFQISNIKYPISNKNLPTIYITGGSGGSHFINVLVESVIPELLERYNVVHQTGEAQEFKDFDRLAKTRESLTLELRKRYEIIKFVEPNDVGKFLNGADLVICRSGMNTITELIYFEKPSILIPLPISQKNEQLKNAKFLEKLGLGKLLVQSEVSSKKLRQAINLMFEHIDNFKIDKTGSKNLPNKNSSENIVEVIKHVQKKKYKTI